MILDPSRHAFRVAPVDELGLLVDADDYFRAFYRAASRAENTILLSGWQFDSGVALLRGAEAEQAGAPVTLLKFLNELCRRKPTLRIWILAWDFSMVFAAEREWMQNVVFEWSSHENLQFRFDSNHVERGCHHQKFVVIDGELSFLGGLDLCEDRWDTRQHKAENPLRVSRDEPHKPFHDIQLYLRGQQVAKALTDLFLGRWDRAGGEPIALPPLDAPAPRVGVDGLLPLPASEVALSRTDPYGTPGGPKLCEEIRVLHEDAIAAAERSIYIETQYFSAQSIYEALEKRLREPRGALEIVLVLNMRGETLKEQAAVGLAQAQNIARLRKVASETAHQLGIYYTLPSCETPETQERATYIHSKLMIVDDRFLTVGSANLTNRSMAVDTELNASIESESAETALGLAIRKVRANLLAEHTGGPEVTTVQGLVAQLDALTQDKREPPCRLRRHPSPTISERAALALVDPQQLPFDPSQVEDFDEEAKTDFTSALKRTVRELFANRRDKG
ncbi:MAG: phospholipase D-like domain-containing protein [Polyangiales bacterium]